MRRLARLYEAHSDPYEAAAVYRQLRERYADTVTEDGTPVAAILDEIPRTRSSDNCSAGLLNRRGHWKRQRSARDRGMTDCISFQSMWLTNGEDCLSV